MLKRKSNLEFLRIISMVLIVAHHYCVHGGFQNYLNTSGNSFNKILIESLGFGGKLGVNLFILISGYFLIDSRFKIEKIKKLWITVTFFSIMIYSLFLFFDENKMFNLKEVIKISFPIIYKEWWFISNYVLLYLMIDYINIFIKSLNKKELEKLIIFLLIIYSILPTFIMMPAYYSEFSWFFFLYLISAYIKMYKKHISSFILEKSLLIGIILYILSIFTATIFNYMGNYYSFFIGKYYYFSGMTRVNILVVSVLIFLGFLKLNIKYSKVINTISSTTLIIYLIHDNNLMRNFLWSTLFKNSEYFYSKFLIFHSIGVIALVFIFSSVLGIFYNKIISEKIYRIINILINKFFIAFIKVIKKLKKFFI